MSNSTRPQDWSSNQSTWQPKAWHRTAGLRALMPASTPVGAASGRVWSHGYLSEQFALQTALDVPRNNDVPAPTLGAIGDIFDGCANPTEMLAFVAASKADSMWKGAGMGVVLGIGIAAVGIYFARK